MSNRHDRHQIAVDEVDDAVREAMNAFGAHHRPSLPGRPDWPGVRCLHTPVDRRENFSLKPVAQTDLTVVVPINVGVELRLGFRVPDDIQCYAC